MIHEAMIHAHPKMLAKAMIVGLAGPELLAEEARFLATHRPAGVILFQRNCVTPEQVRGLVAAASQAAGHEAVIVFIDQEGGRVQRLRPPQWRRLPPAQVLSRLYDRDPVHALKVATAIAKLMAADLRALCITGNCTPVLDVPAPGSHDIIGDRAYGQEPGAIIALGRAVAEAHMAGGVLPVMKHIPGHGRATTDSHLELPVVRAERTQLEATDFAPFRALSHLPAAMTAHVVYAAIDAQAPASTSAIITHDIIRGHMGFDGLLMSDDLGMHALTGPFCARAQAVLSAGSDVVLHCSGKLDEMLEIAAVVPQLTGEALRRWGAAHAVTLNAEPFDAAQAQAYLAEALA